jgi:hypothetical protein
MKTSAYGLVIFFLARFLSSDLKTGTTKEVFHAVGKTPVWSEILNKVVSGKVNEKTQSFRRVAIRFNRRIVVELKQ